MRRYNSPHSMRYRTTQSLIAAVVLICAVAAEATSFSEASALFARDLAGVTGPGSVSLTLRNVSSLSKNEVGEIRQAIETQLQSAGVRTTTPSSAVAEVSILLSENAQGYLWIAEIRQGNDTRVVMRSVPRAQPAIATAPKTRVTLRQTLLHVQPEPILDVAVFGAGTPNAQLAVLDGDKLAIYRNVAMPHDRLQSLPVTHTRPWPRDMRGRLLPASDHLFDAWLPGVICTSAATAPLSMNCREGDDPWPLAPAPQAQSAFYGSARDFFTGVMRPGIGQQGDVPPFYAAAAFDRGNYTLWIMTGVDGKVREFDSVNDRVVSAVADWGSDLATVQSPCGPMLLVTANVDGNAPDHVRAYEISDREPALVSAPVEFAGPVTALWAAADGASANLVVHNPKTDEYEAYSLTIACNQ